MCVCVCVVLHVCMYVCMCTCVHIQAQYSRRKVASLKEQWSSFGLNNAFFVCEEYVFLCRIWLKTFRWRP